MSDTPTPQYWLMTGEVPTGPFSLEQVHVELAANRASWQTPACIVGDSTWVPLFQMPGVGPTAASIATPEFTKNDATPSTPGTAAASSVQATTSPHSSRPAANKKGERISAAVGVVIVIAIFGWLAYLFYDWVRPYTPLEVCQLLDKATTATEAKKYATPRVHAFLDAAYKDKTPDNPNDTFTFTQESDSSEKGIKLVGFRGSMWVPEAGQRVQMEGHFRMVQSSGWKVDDMVMSGMEGVPMTGPISLVDEHHREILRPNVPPKITNLTPKKPTTNLTQPPMQRTGIVGVFDSLKNNYGWGGVVVVIILIAIVMGVKESMKQKKA